MTFFSKIFGNKNTQQDQQPIQVDENLFVDRDQPVLSDRESGTLDELSALDLLLKKDFQPEGFVDGRELHEVTAMEAKMKSIAAMFRNALRQEIEKVNKSMEEIEPYLNDKLKEAIPERYVKLNSRFNNLSLKKAELSAELELALQKEGICEGAMISYRMGFERGFNLWSDETHFKL
jgi:hypothetical protein